MVMLPAVDILRLLFPTIIFLPKVELRCASLLPTATVPDSGRMGERAFAACTFFSFRVLAADAEEMGLKKYSSN